MQRRQQCREVEKSADPIRLKVSKERNSFDEMTNTGLKLVIDLLIDQLKK